MLTLPDLDLGFRKIPPIIAGGIEVIRRANDGDPAAQALIGSMAVKS